MKATLLIVGLSFVAVFSVARAELRHDHLENEISNEILALDEDIQELINETTNEIQKYHLTSMNFESDYCNGPSVPHGIFRHMCKNILQAYLGDHVTSIDGFKAVLYNFVSGK